MAEIAAIVDAADVFSVEVERLRREMSDRKTFGFRA
jgi:hypothetical protein